MHNNDIDTKSLGPLRNQLLAIKCPVLVYKCLHGSAPSYHINNLCQDVNDFVLPRLHHWLAAVIDYPPSVIGLFRSPLLVFGTVCLNTSPPHPLLLSSSSIIKLISSPCRIPSPLSLYSDRTVTYAALDTIIAHVTNLWHTKNNFQSDWQKV